MQRDISHDFIHVSNCIDYRTFIAPLDITMSLAIHHSLKQKLLNLGVADQERMGVVYVRGPWGFLVIPSPGFPELRISFFHDTAEHELDAVLASIRAAMEDSHAASWLTGDENE